MAGIGTGTVIRRASLLGYRNPGWTSGNPSLRRMQAAMSKPSKAAGFGMGLDGVMGM